MRGRERACDGGALGNQSYAGEPGTVSLPRKQAVGQCAQRGCRGKGVPGQGRGGVGWGGKCAGTAPPSPPPPAGPHQTFLPCFCGLIHHLLNCCSGRGHWNRDVAFTPTPPLRQPQGPHIATLICSLE